MVQLLASYGLDLRLAEVDKVGQTPYFLGGSGWFVASGKVLCQLKH